jgi:hypothetical protein
MATGSVKRARRLAKTAVPQRPGLIDAPASRSEERQATTLLVNTANRAKKDVLEKAFASPLVVDTFADQALLRQILSAAYVEELRDLSLRNFWTFVTLCVYPKTWQDHYTLLLHKPLCDALQNMTYNDELWFFIPREHRKSYIVTLLHKVWLILRDPNIRILLVGARKDTVKGWAKLMRAFFTPGTPGLELFQEVFRDYLFPEGYEPDVFEFFHPMRTQTLADPTFRATYLGVTGAGWRVDVLHFDDAVERRNCSHPDMSVKTAGQMMDLWPLVSKTSKYRQQTGVGTRWAYHDPYAFIIGEDMSGEKIDTSALREKLEEHKQLDVWVRHGLEDPDRPCEHCPKHITERHPHGHPDFEKGLAIGAPVITREMLEDELDKYKRDPNKGESLWWHQYMNVCTAPSKQRFKKEWFFVSHMACFPDAKLRVLTIDSADKDFQKPGTGDWMVAQFGEFDDYGRLLLRHGLRDRTWTREGFIEAILFWCTAVRWWPHRVAKEKFGNDNFLTDIGRAFQNRGHLPLLFPVSRPGVGDQNYMKKMDYIVESLQAPYERAEIIYGRDYPVELRSRAMHEAINLGQISHDDVIDTQALFFDPNVRLAVPHQGAAPGGETLRPPDLDLYDIDGPQQFALPVAPGGTPTSMIEQAMQRLQFNVDELGASPVHFDEGPHPPKGLTLFFDPQMGSGEGG